MCSSSSSCEVFSVTSKCGSRMAAGLNELNMEAMYGIIQCLLILGEVKEAEQQLEFLVEVSVSMGKSGRLSYLLAQLTWWKQQEHHHCRDLLDESYDVQMGVCTKSFSHLNIHFAMKM